MHILCGFHSVFDPGGFQYRVSGVLQQYARQFSQRRLVFHYQNSFRARRNFSLGLLDWRDALLGARKINLESGSTARFAVGHDVSVALFDDSVNHRQA